MLHNIRRILGVAALISTLGYMVWVFYSFVADQPVIEGLSDVAEFYTSASLRTLVFSVVSLVFFGAAVAHGGSLLCSGMPARGVALLGLASFAAMFFIVTNFAAPPVPSGASHLPSAPLWLDMVYLCIPPMIQVIDSVLPPWRKKSPESRISARA